MEPKMKKNIKEMLLTIWEELFPECTCLKEIKQSRKKETAEKNTHLHY